MSLPDSSEEPRPPRKKRPAHTLTNGRVVTRIWAERTSWGGVRWQVNHYCRNDFSARGKEFSLEPSDLQDAMRGLFQAQRWIKRTERRRRSWWWW